MRNGPHRILKSREDNSMANCRNCGAEISPLAKVCPYCGMPQQVQEEDPFDQTQAYIPNQGQPSGGNYNSQPAGNGYNNQQVSNYNNQPVNNYNNQPVDNYNNQPINNYNNQPVNNYNNQPMGNGYNMNGGPGFGMDQRPAPMPTGGMIALSIVAMLFCFIGGIITLIKTVNINNALTYAEQQARYASAKKWGIASIIIGIVMSILVFVGQMAQAGVL